MRIEYDAQADAVYVCLVDEITRGMVKRTRAVEHEGIMLDFSGSGTLIGIEVLNAKTRVPALLVGRLLLQKEVTSDLSEEQAIARVLALFPCSFADQDERGWYVRAIDVNGRLYGFLGRAPTGPGAWIEAARLLKMFEGHDLLSEKSPALRTGQPT